jgi:hypothetical protein
MRSTCKSKNARWMVKRSEKSGPSSRRANRDDSKHGENSARSGHVLSEIDYFGIFRCVSIAISNKVKRRHS